MFKTAPAQPKITDFFTPKIDSRSPQPTNNTPVIPEKGTPEFNDYVLNLAIEYDNDYQARQQAGLTRAEFAKIVYGEQSSHRSSCGLY